MGAVEKLPAPSALAAALGYASRGWPVVPIHTATGRQCSCGRPDCGNPGKHPRGVPNGFKSAVTAEAEVRRLFRGMPNVGIATGRRAGVWVLDVDAKDGGEEALSALTKGHGGLPDTVEAITGGGGRHLFFRYPTDRIVRNTVGRLGRGLDTRSDGGGVVASPSVHASGRRYTWAPGRSPDDLPPAEAPEWLYVLLNESGPRPPAAPGAPAPGLRDVAAGYVDRALTDEIKGVASAKEPGRNATLLGAARRLGSLVGAGVLDRATVEASLTTAAICCGLAKPEIAATLRSGLEYGIARPRNLQDLEVVRRDRRRLHANAEAQAGRRKRLRDNKAAQDWLASLGLTRETVERFGFGLDAPYEGKRTGTSRDALTFPLRVADGTPISTMCKADVPGVTMNPRAGLWSNGEPQTFYAEPQQGQAAVLVVDMADLWRLWQELRDTPLATRLQVIASSHSDDLPSEWRKLTFWDQWSNVYVATRPSDGSERTALTISRSAGKPVMRVHPFRGRSWIEAFDGGEDVLALEAALAGAAPIVDRIEAPTEGTELPIGRLAYRPLDIGRAYHNGHLYYLERDNEREVPASLKVKCGADRRAGEARP